ncbi:GDYXXLXY domain-containing protein [Pseudaminobacter sp. 19-2017]|uniref:GDYXXLXY domain-containing protein n=1 Tax=Pseudaminobacter soli (ex Zhang et al. 2022) TaxID=2831468 RepID=A0A942DXY4_9HYPH|nr:GDYXXLXY domain-containing protein [Pseudaminobacter soli]MBS3649621.1 GDYXXLXY domain-containing protein [Pseudaminobacter soli]
MRRSNGLLIAAIAVALVQIGFLSWIVMARAAVLRDGREVILKVAPVDPRDLLRGDYVRLGYDISRIPTSLLVEPPQAKSTKGHMVYVRLRKGADGFWQPAAANLDAPPSGALAPEEVDILGRAYDGQSLEGDTAIRVEYGLERFYLLEGEGRAIERDMNVRNFAVVVAVGSDGTPQIKALMDGDMQLYQEPLY